MQKLEPLKKIRTLIRKFSKNKNEPVGFETRKQLEDEIRDTYKEMELLKNNYHFVSDDMVDYYVYQIKAVEIKYRYLLRKLKRYDAV